jgi:hypothetical protein
MIADRPSIQIAFKYYKFTCYLALKVKLLPGYMWISDYFTMRRSCKIVFLEVAIAEEKEKEEVGIGEWGKGHYYQSGRIFFFF